MSTRVQPHWMPGYGWWAVLAVILATGIVGSWLVAGALLLVLLTQAARPFDFVMSSLLVTAGATFIRYEAGQLTFEFSVLTMGILFMLIAYAFTKRGRMFVLARTSLLIPLLLYVGMSFANFARGLWVGHSPKSSMLELLPVLALASSVLLANCFDPRRHLRLTVWGLVVIALGSSSLGFYVYSILGGRTGGVYFTPVPGIIALLTLNLALRSKNPLEAVGWTVLTLPLFLHQFLSYTRGYWMGCMVGVVGSVLAFARFGEGSITRWRRAAVVTGFLGGMGVVGALFMAVVLGHSDFLALASSRFGSMTGTEFSYETASNVTRLAEYGTVFTHISHSPWLGHGLGYSFLHRDVISFKVYEQWWVHQNYLLVWLKQGLVGLVLFVWMLFAATALGIRAANEREDPWESAWCGATAMATIFLAVLSLSNFHLDEVNATFTLAFLWGGAMGIGRKGFVVFRWSPLSGGKPGFREHADLPGTN